MAVSKIQYQNKTAIQNDEDIPRQNKVTDEDMNEIKNVVNNNADELNTAKENVENLQEGQGTANTDITNLKSRVFTLEADNTKNKSDIEDLQKDNETNQSNIGKIQQKTKQIEENISDIQQEQKTQNTEIENLQTEVQELNEDIKANAIIEETEKSKSLYIDDANASRGKVNVFGNMEQEIREGYNLIDILNSTLINTNKSVEIEIDKDGYVIANGTPTADYIVFIRKSIDNLIEDKQTYSLWQEKYSSIQTGAIYSQILATPKEGSSASPQYIVSGNQKVTFTVDKTNYTYSWAIQTSSISNAGTFNNYRNRYMLYKGTGNKEFELYGASPSFDYLSEIKCVGSNKNLYPGWEIGSISSETGQNTDDSSYIRSIDFISVIPKEEYTIASYNLKEITQLNTAIRMYNESKEYIGNQHLGLIENTGLTFVLTNPDVKYVKIVSFNGNTVTDTAKADIKLEKGEVATPYSTFNHGSTGIKHLKKNIFNKNNFKYINAYIGASSGKIVLSNNHKTLYIGVKENTDYVISKIKGTTFRAGFCNSKPKEDDILTNFVTNETTTSITLNSSNNSVLAVTYYDGQGNEQDILNSMQIEVGKVATEYEEYQEEIVPINMQEDMVSEDDYFDLEREKEVHGWKKVIFDGVNNKFTDSFANGNNTVFRYNGTNWDSPTSITSTEVKSTHFKVDTSWSEGTMYAKYTSDGVAIQAILKTEIASNYTALNNLLKQKYDAGEPVIVYFKDEAQTELDLTDTQIQQLEKLNKLRFYEGVNNIMTTEDIALLQAKYSQNLKVTNTKMQQQIDEIKELLSTTQTSAMLLDNLEKDLIEEVK